MFIAHFPAGYIGACLISGERSEPLKAARFWPFIIGSVFPDVDMLYFYLIDRGRHLHHHYWTHLAAFWLCFLVAGLLLAALFRSRRSVEMIWAFVAGIFLHLVLDTPFGGILWLYPFSERSFHLVQVPATRSWWVWSFVFHWGFLFEIVICIAAGVVYFQRRNRSHESA